MNVIGVDEVGRGCLAGPLLVIAALSDKRLPVGTKDSKLLSRGQRQRLYRQLIELCRFGEGWVSASEINSLGLSSCLRLGVSRALKNLKAGYHVKIIIDGKINLCGSEYTNVEAIVKADNSVPIVSAASIYAKLTRDNFMENLSLLHPAYGFNRHKGYGTAQHRQALDEHGVIDGIHRINFSPLKFLHK